MTFSDETTRDRPSVGVLISEGVLGVVKLGAPVMLGLGALPWECLAYLLPGLG